MSQSSSKDVIAGKLFENLIADLKALSIEAKKKHPPVKEAAEACMLKLRMLSQKSMDLLADLLSHSSDVIQPFILGCDSKHPKMVHISLTAMQRMVQHEAVSATTADNIIKTLLNLMNTGVEELKLLQTVILIITTNSIVQHDSLAKAIVLGFRLYFTKDSTTINTAGATVRQLVNVVYERVVTEDSIQSQAPLEPFSKDKVKVPSKIAPDSLRPCAQDGFLLFQDLCQLVNADNPVWLVGITEMTRTFGLELLESVMSGYPQLFLQHEEFSYLLKERVCPLVIKLFSPSLKFKQATPSMPSPVPAERPYFPIVMRLIRIVQTLIRNYYSLLSTECEIFLSLLVKFTDIEKPLWQRCLALEVIQKLCSDVTLVRSFVETYDMKEHSAKIFQDMVNAIGSFVQTHFMAATNLQSNRESNKSLDTQGAPPALVGGLPIGSGVTPQPAFVYKNIWIPIIMNVPQAAIRPILIEMMDKMEPPSIPDGYALTLGFAALLDLTNSIEQNILQTVSETGDRRAVDDDRPVNEALINSSWCGVLASLSLLLDSSTDEQATQAILKAQQSYVHLSGLLEINTTRDAFVTALCKSALPPHYGLGVLNSSGKQSHDRGHMRVPSTDMKQDDTYEKSQVVAIGTAFPTVSSSGAATQQVQVTLTAKNICCMKAILYLTICHGSVLGSSWYMLLTTLQHLAWILGLKASTRGQLKVEKSGDNSSSIITTAIMSELPEISHMLSRLFESSQYLDDVAIHHLIGALCKLSNESMEVAITNRDPSLFAVAKILETGLVNLHRVDILWKPLTAHLLEVCQHPQPGMRCCGAEAITTLVSAAVQFNYDPPLHQNKRLQAMLLAPLRELSVISHIDVRQKQLECALQILQNIGESLGPGWPTILQVIGDGANSQGEPIIRTAFQSIQLVVTDFLLIISPTCLSLCVETAAKFGLQQSELNISLTAIGLLWNISDFFYQQRKKIAEDIEQEADVSLTSTDQLWLCLYSKFGELCVDPRPAVRKSSGQTLFSTIAAHGDLLDSSSWKSLLWKVLFPLLDNVRKNLDLAPSEREKKGPEANILMHHSRDTARKQWSETQVLIMAGVSRVFSSRRGTIQELDDFQRSWAFLLHYIEKASLSSGSNEVALAALRSFQELITDQTREEPGTNSSSDSTADRDGSQQNASSKDSQTTWRTAWKIWLAIGSQRTNPPGAGQSVDVPSQAFLCHLIQIFPKMFPHVSDIFISEMFDDFSKVLSQALAVPIAGDTSPFLVPTNYDSTLTPVQENILKAYDCLRQYIPKLHYAEKLYPKFIYHLIKLSECSVKPPRYGSVEVKAPNSVKGLTTGYIGSDMTEFAEKCMSMGVDVYAEVARLDSVIHDEMLKHIILSLHVPLSSKYTCVATTWRLAVQCLIKAVSAGLKISCNKNKHIDEEELWPALSKTLNDFLFPKVNAEESQSLTEFKEDEGYDCMIIEMVERDILPHSDKLPKEFISSLVQILNKGSLNSQSSSGAVAGKVRSLFTQKCFDILLLFSFSNKSDKQSSAPVSQVAIKSMIDRCTGIIKSYSEQLELSTTVPSPRSQVTEIASAVRVVGTMLVSFAKLPEDSVQQQIWTELIEVYPQLVKCLHSRSDEILYELETTLTQYQMLLRPPCNKISNGS